jgi:hypothetical protein
MSKIRKVSKKPVEEVEEEVVKKPKKKLKESEIGPPVYKNRFIAAIQDAKELSMYRHFSEANTLTEIKKISEKEVADALKEDKIDVGVLVMDREGWFTAYRYNLCPQTVTERDHKGKIKMTDDAETRIKSWVKDK